MKKYIIIISLIFYTPTYAFDLSGGASAVQSLQQLIKITKQMDDSINRLKEQQELLNDIKRIQNMRHTDVKDALKNGRLSSMIEDLEFTLNSIGDGPQGTVKALQNAINDLENKLGLTTNDQERRQIERQISALKRQEALAKLQKNTSGNLKKTAEGEAEVELIRITAENTSTLAALAVDAQQERDAERSANREAVIQEREFRKGAINIYRSASKSREGR